MLQQAAESLARMHTSLLQTGEDVLTLSKYHLATATTCIDKSGVRRCNLWDLSAEHVWSQAWCCTALSGEACFSLWGLHCILTDVGSLSIVDQGFKLGSCPLMPARPSLSSSLAKTVLPMARKRIEKHIHMRSLICDNSVNTGHIYKTLVGMLLLGTVPCETLCEGRFRNLWR